MDTRKEIILNTIINEHIKSGAPVGSGVLVSKYQLNISPATARNEMAALEEEGYIAQPHTSAGRVPTEKAYRRFIDNLPDSKLNKKDAAGLKNSLIKQDENAFKTTAKEISQLTGNAVFWAFHRHNIYYTGISNLFQQPEFSQVQLIYDISTVIDRIDEIIDDIFDQVKLGTNTMIGRDNPFGDFCGTVLVKYRSGDDTGLFGIVGPLRMNYEKNVAIANYVNSKIGSSTPRRTGN